MINLPLKTVQKMASQHYIDKVLADVQTLNELTESIHEEGFLEPLLIYVTDEGTCYLKDGHHRLVIGSHLFYITLPVEFRWTQDYQVPTDYGLDGREVMADYLEMVEHG